MVNSSQPHFYYDTQSLGTLKAQARKDQTGSLAAVAEQFESLFVGMVLKSMRAAVMVDAQNHSQQMDFYQEMFDQQLAVHLARNGGLGLKDMLINQLSGNQNTPSQTRYNSPWKTSDSFVRDLWPHAENAAQQLGVEPKWLVAQAALETGWGRHLPMHDDGRPSYSLFGIKADTSWAGEQISRATLEYRDGQLQREAAQFRAYDSMASAVQDYTDFLLTQPRYQTLFADDGDFAQALQRAGYATDPHYAEKIHAILDSVTFRDGLQAAGQT